MAESAGLQRPDHDRAGDTTLMLSDKISELMESLYNETELEEFIQIDTMEALKYYPLRGAAAVTAAALIPGDPDSRGARCLRPQSCRGAGEERDASASTCCRAGSAVGYTRKNAEKS